MSKTIKSIGFILVPLMVINSCGGGSSSYKFENTVSSVKTNIVGTWKSECIDTGDEFSKRLTKVFTKTVYTSTRTLYIGATCATYDVNSTSTWNYTIGALTSQETVEINFNSATEQVLTVVKFDKDQLYIANNINDKTVGIRETDFSQSPALTKQ